MTRRNQQNKQYLGLIGTICASLPMGILAISLSASAQTSPIAEDAACSREFVEFAEPYNLSSSQSCQRPLPVSPDGSREGNDQQLSNQREDAIEPFQNRTNDIDPAWSQDRQLLIDDMGIDDNQINMESETNR